MKKFLAHIAVVLAAAIAAASGADSLYVKGSSFADSVAKSGAKYREWKSAADAKFAEDFKVSDVYASFAFPEWNKSEIKAADPVANPVNLKTAFDGEYVWKKLDFRFGRSFDLQFCNPRYFSRCVFYVYFTVDAAKAAKIPLTISSGAKCELFVNSKPAAVLDAYDKSSGKGYFDRPNVTPFNGESRTTDFKVLDVDLKKGENKFALKFSVNGQKVPVLLYMSFCDDPAVDLSRRISADFPAVSDAVFRAGANRQLVPSLLSARDNRDIVAGALSMALERSLFSAGKFEKRLEKLMKDPSADAERIALLEDMITTRAVENALGYDVANVRAAMEDMKKSFPEYEGDFAALAEWEKKMPEIKSGLYRGDANAKKAAEDFGKFAAKSLLANPLLKKHRKWAFIFRPWGTRGMGLPQNWQGNSVLTNAGFHKGRADSHNFKDELWISGDITSPENAKKVLAPNSAVADIDVSYDGSKILYSTVDDKVRWQLDEFDVQ
ncbi:MAG: hypothetical protein J6J65_06020, partial [Opitutales bacterium]|nr:hypothetical protein [Opitutales bacterium]